MIASSHSKFKNGLSCTVQIIVINENDPLAKKYNDISDVPEEETEAIYKWFRDYKTAAGKGQLEYFPTDGEAKDHWYSAEQAIEVSILLMQKIKCSTAPNTLTDIDLITILIEQSKLLMFDAQFCLLFLLIHHVGYEQIV